MTPFSVAFLVVLGIALLGLPRKWAPLPLLMGTCFVTLGQGIAIGPFSFTFLRLLVLLAFVRILARGERPAASLVPLDKIVLVWAAWMIAVSVFHQPPVETLVFHLGLAYNTLGVYFAIRCLCSTSEHTLNLMRLVSLILVPVAVEMILEHLFRYNFFSVFGGVEPSPLVRNDRIRAQGPFFHPILAGTVGAVCLPLMVAILRVYPTSAALGIASSLVIVVASASSGPILSLAFGTLAILLFRFRGLLPAIRVGSVLLYVILDLAMKAPAYYLLARIDLTGGSTGYHRAALIESAIEHFHEWWAWGTDYTRHWMPYGVSWSEEHADITNHYLGQGVKGGMPLLLLFAAMLFASFRNTGIAIRAAERSSKLDPFLPWCVGSALFAHTATCISVAYFDQSIVFLNATLALSACLRSDAEIGDEREDASPSNTTSDLPYSGRSVSVKEGGDDSIGRTQEVQ